MALILKLIIATVIGNVFIDGVLPIWRCTSKPAEPIFRPNDPFFKACHFTRLNMLSYIDNGDHTYTLESTTYGIDGVENKTHFTDKELRAYINNKFGLDPEDLPYLGKLVTEAKVVVSNALGYFLVFQSVFSCSVTPNIDLDTANPSEDPFRNTRDFLLYTGPIHYNFPSVGNCTPIDQYIPHEYWKDHKVITLEFENHSNITSNITDVLSRRFGYGVHWTPPSKFQTLIESDPTIEFRLYKGFEHHKNPPVFSWVLNDLALRFSQLSPSHVTNVRWENNFTTTLHIIETKASSVIQGVLEPNSSTIFYKLVGVCGDYAVITEQVYKRVSDLDIGSCKGYLGARDGIEKCDFCTRLECADRKAFLEAHQELREWLVES